MRGLLGHFGEQRIAKVHIGQDRGKRISTSVMGKKEGGSPEDTFRPLHESLFLYSGRVETRVHHSS